MTDCFRRQVRELTLCHWPDSTFDPAVIQSRFPELRNLTVMYSEITRVKDFGGDFKELQVRLLGTMQRHGPLNSINVSSVPPSRALWPSKFDLVFPHYRCPFCSVHSSCPLYFYASMSQVQFGINYHLTECHCMVHCCVKLR